MPKLVLRNDRGDNGAWFVTAAVFALAGVAAFCGLVVANVRDPKARWMGPNVQHAQAIYLVFDAVVLVVTVAMVLLAVVRGRRFFDRSVQLVIDETGIHDRRSTDGPIAWSEVADVKTTVHTHGGIANFAQLTVVTTAGQTIGIDILGLDQDPKSILKAVTRIKKAGGQQT